MGRARGVERVWDGWEGRDRKYAANEAQMVWDVFSKVLKNEIK